MRPTIHASETEKERLCARIAALLTVRPEITLAVLFGSFVDQAEFHDIDVGVLLDPTRIPEAQAWGFANQLATELEWDSRCPVDLIVLNQAPIALRYRASGGRVLLSRDQEAYYGYLERTWKEYLDFEPFLRASLRELLARR